MHAGISFPVGKVDFLAMYPLSFQEFLYALGEKELADCIGSLENDKMDTYGTFRHFEDGKAWRVGSLDRSSLISVPNTMENG